jgi:hypothetical protein
MMSTGHLNALCRVLWRKAKRIGVVFRPGAAVDGAPPLQPQTGATAPAPSTNLPVNPSTPPAPACIRSIDTLLEHPGPPLAPDHPR